MAQTASTRARATFSAKVGHRNQSPQQATEPTQRQSRGHAGSSQGRVRGELEAVEGVGGDGRDGMKCVPPFNRRGEAHPARIHPAPRPPLLRGGRRPCRRLGGNRHQGSLLGSGRRSSAPPIGVHWARSRTAHPVEFMILAISAARSDVRG